MFFPRTPARQEHSEARDRYQHAICPCVNPIRKTFYRQTGKILNFSDYILEAFSLIKGRGGLPAPCCTEAGGGAEAPAPASAPGKVARAPSSGASAGQGLVLVRSSYCSGCGVISIPPTGCGCFSPSYPRTENVMVWSGVGRSLSCQPPPRARIIPTVA